MLSENGIGNKVLEPTFLIIGWFCFDPGNSKIQKLRSSLITTIMFVEQQSKAGQNVVEHSRSQMMTTESIMKIRVFTRHMVIILLLRSGLESNPGPRKQKRPKLQNRCLRCGKFAPRNDCLCSLPTHQNLMVSVETSQSTLNVPLDIDSSDKPNPINNVPAVTDPLPITSSTEVLNDGCGQFSLYCSSHNDVVTPPTSSQVQRKCSRFGVSFSGYLCDTKPLHGFFLGRSLPITSVAPGDGNCLFAALSVAVGSSSSEHVQL